MSLEDKWVQDPRDGLSITPRAGRGRRVQRLNFSESRTVQSDRNESEMTAILAKYQGTGIVDHLSNVDLKFRDVTEFTDMVTALRQVRDAEADFMTLDPNIRRVFDNSAAAWLDAAHDGLTPAQHAKLVKLGLVDPPAPSASSTADTGSVVPPASDGES